MGTALLIPNLIVFGLELIYRDGRNKGKKSSVGLVDLRLSQAISFLLEQNWGC